MTAPRLVGVAALWAGITGLNMILQPPRYAARVEVEPLAPAPMPLIVRASGNLEAKDSSIVKSQFEGTVNSKHFREGQTVTKGQILAVISREKIRLEHQTKLDDLASAKAELQRARKDLKIQRELFKKEAVAYSAVEDAERALVKSQSALRSAEESYRLAEIQWNSAYVRAPISGTVVKDWI